MVTLANEKMRHCSICGQVSPVGLPACPRCGARNDLGHPRMERSSIQKHPQVVAAVITFCVGLLLLRLALGLWNPGVSLGSMAAATLRRLEFIAIVSSVIYIILRESEGDFRSLFLIALSLFVGQEALVYGANTFWIGDFRALGILLTFSSCIYSALALIAAVYDPPAADTYRTPMLVACLVILLVSVFRALGTLPLPPFDRYHHLFGIVVLVGAMVYLAACLFRTEAGQHVQQAAALPPDLPAEDRRLDPETPRAEIPPGADGEHASHAGAPADSQGPKSPEKTEPSGV
jgi:hypothetical protein